MSQSLINNVSKLKSLVLSGTIGATGPIGPQGERGNALDVNYFGELSNIKVTEIQSDTTITETNAFIIVVQSDTRTSNLNGIDTVSSKKYVFGVKSGQWKSFYSNGKPKEYATYKFNELEGPFTHFFENGNKQYEGNYYRGRRTNDWIYYNSKGRPIFKETYRKGLIVSKQEINKP